jgi:tetratricopeptide (TPR) repeat protein
MENDTNTDDAAKPEETGKGLRAQLEKALAENKRLKIDKQIVTDTGSSSRLWDFGPQQYEEEKFSDFVDASWAIEKLQKLAKSKKYDELESEWMEAIETELANVDDLFSILDLLARRKDTELAESLLYYLVSEQTDQVGVDAAIAAVRRGAVLLPESTMLREEAAGLYEKAHTSSPAITEMIAATIRSMDTALPDAIGQMETLLALPPGTYVLEEKAPGRVATSISSPHSIRAEAIP